MDKSCIHFVSVNIRGLGKREKRDIVFKWLKRQNADICFLQETYLGEKLEKIIKNEWEVEILSSFGSAHSRGVTIIYDRNLKVEVKNKVIASDGRTILLNLLIHDIPCTLVNVYAPTNYKERELFFKKTLFWLKRNVQHSLILGGDLNCVQDKAKDTKNIKNKNIECSKFLKKIMKHFNLIDIWRKTWPEKRQYTWRQISLNLHSRLDYWLIQKNLLQKIESTDIRPSVKTDHNAISLKVKFGKVKNGPGYWKFNSSLTNDTTYKIKLSEIISKCKRHCEIDGLSKQLTWEMCKRKIKDYTIEYCKIKATVKRDILKMLERDVEDLELKSQEDHNSYKNSYINAKLKLEKMYANAAKGAIVRSRVKWHEEGEINSKYFIGLEKHNNCKNSITELKSKNGKNLTNVNEILNETVDFYQNLYKSKHIDEDLINNYVNNTEVPQLNQNDQLLCDGPLTIDECTIVVKKLKLNRSPGSDGLTTEFYNCFWDDIKYLMVNAINEGYRNGELSFSQRRGIIKLIHKKGEKNKLDNYRPITLLNYDYKICTAALARRIQNVIKKIISDDQCGYIQGRFIGRNIRVIEDIIDYCDEHDNNAAILFIDFQKAFDSLEINFLEKCLRKFNFGNSFIKWVKTTYNNVNSCISINGWLSRSFEIERGIRQGCPLSALLFIISAEFMSLNIKTNKNIEGFNFFNDPDLETKITQLADDTTIFVNNPTSVKFVFDEIERFSSVSGIVLNKSKTDGIYLGRQNQIDIDTGIKWSDEPVKSLGIYFGKNKKEVENLNMKPKLVKLENIINRWKARKLTYYGKVTIIKTLGISQILYNASCINVPDYVITNINKIIYRFLWGSKKEKVKRTVITKDFDNGGLHMINIQCQINALKIKWISRMLQSKNTCIWGNMIDCLFKPLGGLELLLELNCKAKVF